MLGTEKPMSEKKELDIHAQKGAFSSAGIASPRKKETGAAANPLLRRKAQLF